MPGRDGFLQVLSIYEPESWRTYLPAWRSVFGSLEFASIAQEYTGGTARLFVFRAEDGQGIVAYPLFLRPVSELQFAPGMTTQAWDAASPEYTGPILLVPPAETAVRDFRSQFDAYCLEQEIITEFAHLDPWKTCASALLEEHVRQDREIVYVDLGWSRTDMWQNAFTRACRKNIRRASAEHVQVFAATERDHIRQFYQVYVHTMDRNRASARYYFPLEFFMAFFDRMSENARFALAEYKGAIVAGTLFLHDGQSVYSYLGGAYQEYQDKRPTNAVIYDTICWAQSQGKKRMILGGGYRRNDGIFRFKASFSPLRARFNVYRHIHIPEQFDLLRRAWVDHYGSDVEHREYFPAYRYVPEGERQGGA
jgi:serine/alanine adding enzyme